MDYLNIYRNAIRWIEKYTLTHEQGKAIVTSSRTQLGYPEVSGYYIPTLIHWGYRKLAYSYMEWLLSSQAENGAWMDIHGRNPYVFDTAQVLKGLLAIRKIYPSEKLDVSIRRSCDWLLTNMQEDGRLTTPDMTDWESNSSLEIVHIYCLSPLYEAAEVCCEDRYRQAADKIRRYYLTQKRDWIMEFRLLSHFYAYLMEALLDIGEVEMCREAMEKISALQTEEGAVPGYFNVHWVCSTGLFQLAMVWYRLGERERGEGAFRYACSLQNPSGGWYGSYPVKGYDEANTYFPQEEISWAVKFFLDALYYREKADFEYWAPQFLPVIDKGDGRYQLIKNMLMGKQGMKVLDAGCGKGRYLQNLLEDVPGHSYYAVDLSVRVLEELKCLPIDKRPGSLTDLPFEDDTFDLVYTTEAMEHAIDLESAVRESARVSKDGGVIVVIDKNTDMLGRLHLAPLEQWLDKRGFAELLKKYCSEVAMQENVMYEGRQDGLFTAWIGKVDKRKEIGEAPLISVVLPVYNGERYLSNAIESVRGQTLTDWELIIVNDCSTDSSDKIIEKYARLDSRIHVINNETNKKLPASLNVGFTAARGKYLTWTSDDNMYMPQALEKMHAFLSSNVDYAMVIARMTHIDDDGKFLRIFDAYDPVWMWLYNLVGACFMYRREVLFRIGGYEERLFLVEDYEYWLRIMEHCGSIGALPEVLYAYRMHSGSLTAKKKADIAKNLQLMRKWHMPYILNGLKSNVISLHYLYEAFVRSGEAGYIQKEMKKVLPGIEREKFDFPKGEYIVLGTGKQANELLRAFDGWIRYFADINPSTIGQYKAGRQIISFSEVLKHIGEGALLIIAVPLNQNYEVIKQATAAGLDEYRTYWGYQRIKDIRIWQETHNRGVHKE